MIHVLGDRVLVALPPKEAETTTPSGLVLVRDPELRTQTRGIVMQLGEKRGQVDLDDALALFPPDEGVDWNTATISEMLKGLAPAPFDVAVGDCVLFPPHVGDPFTHDGIDYVIVYESDIIGILEKQVAA
jgi:co-chaperonin GroES (HSP10)